MKLHITSPGQRKINLNYMNEKHIAREAYQRQPKTQILLDLLIYYYETRTKIVVQF